MGARRLARARVEAVTSAGRVRGSGAAVQLWGGLEGADLGEAVQRSGRPAFVAMMEPTAFGQLDDLTHRRWLDHFKKPNHHAERISAAGAKTAVYWTDEKTIGTGWGFGAPQGLAPSHAGAGSSTIGLRK